MVDGSHETEATEVETFKGWQLVLEVKDAFEECIELHWSLQSQGYIGDRMHRGNKTEGPPELTETILEMVIDRDGLSPQPAKDAHVKRVPCGSDRQASLGMPEGRRFLICATAEVKPGLRLRSAWVRTATLRADQRAPGWVGLDPLGRTRQSCKNCPCKSYVPFKWGANSRDRGRCRRCGCGCQLHSLVGEALGGGSSSSLRERAEEWKTKNGREEVEPLPPEAVPWSDRECDLWFRTGGLFHPQQAREERASATSSSRPAQQASQGSGVGRRRHVSVLTPTTDTRAKFHESLWACFEAQTWPDKELVVVETYTSSPSTFLKEKAAEDNRLVYVGYQRPEGQDWSIGLKRNICAQLSTGEVVAHFDDDDLYAPEYLSRMVKELQDTGAQGVKLASWFVFDNHNDKWIHCDPLASSAKRGADETEEWTRQWLYGYGFSYVYLRQAAMEHPYPDVNLGEDYEFFTSIQEAKGKSSIALVQDDSGVCLHTQHSANTSSSQHLLLRELTHTEVLDLEVADLHPVFTHHLQRLQVQETMRLFMGEAETDTQLSRRRYRNLCVHTPDRAVTLRCTAGATADELRPLLEESLGPLPVSARLFWAPPPGRVQEDVRAELVARALRLVAPCLPLPSGKPGPEQVEAAKRAERPLNPQDRIGSRTSELWLVLPEGARTGRSSQFVRVTVQKPMPGSIWDAFHLELPPDANVIELRRDLGLALQPGARILAQKPGRQGLVDLSLGDPVPDKVTISDYAAKITADMALTKNMCLELQVIMKDLVAQPEMQEKIAALEVQAKGNEKMFNVIVFSLLAEDVFPRMAEHFDMTKAPIVKVFQGAIDVHCSGDLEAIFNFLELELLMKNKSRITVAALRLKQAMETLSPEDRVSANRRFEKIQQAYSWQEVPVAPADDTSRTHDTEATAPTSASPPAEGKKAQDFHIVNGWELSLDIGGIFEECIDLNWHLERFGSAMMKAPEIKSTTLEMVLDRGGPPVPPKDAHVNRVPCGKDRKASLSMPEGRRFLIAATAEVSSGQHLRSAWLRTATLRAAERPKGWQSVDPMGKTRQNCKVCPCKGYVPFKWGQYTRDNGRCRRCGCSCGSHALGAEEKPDDSPTSQGGTEEERGKNKREQARAEEWRGRNDCEQAAPLPPESADWSDRECDLWFRTDGLFHPRRAREELRPAQQASASSTGGRRRRVSVIAPTAEAQRSLHESLWACFEAQTWHDKELIVVETYTSSPSAFLREKAAADSRLVYASFQRPHGEEEWTVGLKRNICAQLSSGDILAHFDDGDLYAPEYLSRMVKELQDAGAKGVKLASRFAFDCPERKWIHFDPRASSANTGSAEMEEWMRELLYGGGFSYVYQRQAALDHPFRDLDQGEDYQFFTRLLEEERNCISLVEDERGICLHTERGESAVGPQRPKPRELSREEVLDLEVADLHPVFRQYVQRLQVQESLERLSTSGPEAGAASQRRYRRLRVHTPERELRLRCPAGATASELQALLEKPLGGALPAGARLFRAPPAGHVPDLLRQELLARARRLAAPCLALPSGEPSPEQREAAERVEQPLRPEDRIGARTTELWLVFPTGAKGGRSLPYVRVMVQKPPPPGSVWGTFHVELPPSATVMELRHILGTGLPLGARIMAPKQNGSLVDLRMSELVPDKVEISEFAAKITPDFVITKQMAFQMQAMIKDLLRKGSFQEKIRLVEARAAGNEKTFNMLVFGALAEDVLPRVAEQLDLVKAPMIKIFLEGIEVHGKDDPEFVVNALEISLLFRNKERIAQAHSWLRSLREKLGPEDLDLLECLLLRLAEYGGASLPKDTSGAGA